MSKSRHEMTGTDSSNYHQQANCACGDSTDDVWSDDWDKCDECGSYMCDSCATDQPCRDCRCGDDDEESEVPMVAD